MQCGQLSILRQWCRRVYRLFKWIPSQCTRPVRRLDIFTALLCVLFDKYSHGKNIWLNIKLVVFVCFLWFLFSISVIIWCLLSVLRPVHTGDYSRRFRRQFVAENGDCCRIRRLSPKPATVAKWPVHTGDYSRQCGHWTGHYNQTYFWQLSASILYSSIPTRQLTQVIGACSVVVTPGRARAFVLV